MPNHLHLVARVAEGGNLSAVVRDFKKYTSYALLKAIEENPQESRQSWLLWMFRRAGRDNPNNTNAQLWQQHSHAVELSTNEKIRQRVEYTHLNPVRAGICFRPEDYVYSSAAQYAGLDPGLPVSLIG